MASHTTYVFIENDHLYCIQAEEERKEQALNRKRKSIAGRKGAKKVGIR